MDILFDEFPELKEAFDLKEEFRKLLSFHGSQGDRHAVRS
jgi:hypothetical protein